LLVLTDNRKTKAGKDDFFLSGCRLSIQSQKVCLIDNLQVASMPGHSIKQTAWRKIAVKLAQITQRNKCNLFSFSFYKFAQMFTHRHILYLEVHVQVLVVTPQVQVLQNCIRVQLEYKYKYQLLQL